MGVKTIKAVEVQLTRKSKQKEKIWLRRSLSYLIISFNHGSVVQLVRTPACHAGGHGFEPHSSRQHFIRRNADLCFSGHIFMSNASVAQ